ncbi:MAG: S9 family peptidase [Acidimicrobiia bacterium]|nr:S9 family peptidase [Acidimicrobiia bacterium]MDH3462442.1 S9 family peptidase [Acidimicrobiia bacterium]
MATSRRMALEDLAALRWAMEPAAHPSEPLLAYVVSGPDRATDHLGYDLFVTDLEGVERLHQPNARAPRWSPQGDRIAFSRMESGRRVPVCQSLSGDEWKLQAPPGDLLDLRWATDGLRLLALTSTTQPPPSSGRPYRVASSADFTPVANHRAWVLEADAEPILIGADLGNTSIAEWSPDGERIAVVSDKGVDRDASTAAGLWVWDARTGESECLVPPAVPIYAVAWSPDGSSLAYLAAARDNAYSAINDLWVLDVASRTDRQLGVGLDRSLGKPVRGDDERAVGAPILAWSGDSSSVTAIYAEGGRSRLARFDLDGSFEDVIADESCVLEFSHGGAGIAYSWSDPVTPGGISWFDATSGEATQVTHLAGAVLSDVQLAQTTEVSVVASDGIRVEGWLTLPEGSSKSPLVLQVHGGPHYAIGERFSFDAQRLAAQGIAFLRANPRGSQGYGQAFADGNLGDWGGRDFEDLMELVDEVTGRASIDSERVAIIGESYGGYVSAWAAGTSDRFAAVVVESGIADFFSSAGGAIGPTFWHSELGGSPWENPTLYLERSAITRLHRVTAPVLVIHCEQDRTCSITQGEAIHAGLRELGREVEFLRVPEEGHFFNVFGALSRRLERTAVLDGFLVKHLRADAGKEGPETREITS